MDKKFNEETVKEDIEAIKDKIDSIDLQLFEYSMKKLQLKHIYNPLVI